MRSRSLSVFVVAAIAAPLMAQTTQPSNPAPTPPPPQRLAPTPPPPSAALYPGRPGLPETPELPADIEQRASCLLQIDNVASAYGVRNDATTISLLLSSTAFSEPVIEKMLKLPAGALGRQVIISTSTASPRMLRVEVALRKGEKHYDSGAAASLLKGLLERLTVALEQSAEAEAKAQQAQLKEITSSMESVKKRLAVVSLSLKKVREATSSAMAYEDPTMTLQNLRSQRRQAEQEISRMEGQLAARQPAGDPIAAWEAAVAAQSAAVASLETQVKEGKVQAAKLAEAQANLADARTKLAAARQSSSNDRSTEMEVRNLRSQIASQEARLKPIKEQLEKLESPELEKHLTDYRENQSEEQRLRSELQELTQSLRTAERAVRDRAIPTITLIDGATR
jgi:hypothetical protein